MNYEIRSIVESIREYIVSPHGQRELADAMRKAEETCRQMDEASRVSWKDLFEPMII